MSAAAIKWFARVAGQDPERKEPLDNVPLYAVAALVGRAFYTGSNVSRGVMAATTIGAGMAMKSVVSSEAVQRTGRAAMRISEQGLIPEDAITLFDNTDNVNEWLVTQSQKAGSGKTWGLGPALVVTSAENVQHILGGNFKNYIKGLEMTTMFRDVLGDGIFNTNGELWKQQRKTGVRIFTKRNFQGFMNEVFHNNAYTLSDLLAKQASSGEALDIQDLYYKYTLESIGTIGFGVELGLLKSHPARNAFADAFDGAQQRMLSRLLNPISMGFPEVW
jgi:cytochrome P450